MEDSLTLGERPDLAALFNRPVRVVARDLGAANQFGVGVEYFDGKKRRQIVMRALGNTEDGLRQAVQVLKDRVNG